MKLIDKIFQRSLIVITMACAITFVTCPVTAFAATSAGSTISEACNENANSGACADLKKTDGFTGMVKNIIGTVLFIAGITSVIVIIYSGILYVTAGGDTNRVTKAKNVLTYAIVGLIVSISSYAIVEFVLGKL